MTVAVYETLVDVIDDVLERFQGSKGNRETGEWIRENHPAIYAENSDMLAAEGLNSIIRSRRKDRPQTRQTETGSRQICIDFGIPFFRFDREISIPLDPLNPLGCKADWKEIEDATLDEIRAHAALLRAEAASNVSKAEKLDRLIDGAQNYEIPGEHATLRALQIRAARQRKGK